MKTIIKASGLALAIALSPQVFATNASNANSDDMVNGTITLTNGTKISFLTSRENANQLKKSPQGTSAYADSININNEWGGTVNID
ncbi:Uncharacterised protein (plasmid) [Legionella adelaidensis]|uniref:Uncharacterized protein n=1 Tax=Legionella adelaidensis TaxID=45056 RepID=A0A0W0R3G7_9GAMM|nr:hypothetical protein [Legionella adelaidensis]KTC65586.1 hypothetical protein Lade_0244 [Legionella adelaidensis]VEH85217.1 Uncharacterised protein [Legionella adelaidensis]